MNPPFGGLLAVLSAVNEKRRVVTEPARVAAQGSDIMIGKIVETISIVGIMTGLVGMMYPRDVRLNVPVGTLWFLCGAAVCYVWL